MATIHNLRTEIFDDRSGQKILMDIAFLFEPAGDITDEEIEEIKAELPGCSPDLKADDFSATITILSAKGAGVVTTLWLKELVQHALIFDDDLYDAFERTANKAAS